MSTWADADRVGEAPGNGARGAGRRWRRGVAASALFLIGGLIAIVLLKTGGSGPAPRPLATSTALVRRADVVEAQLIPGALGFAGSATVVSDVAGVVTALPRPGASIARGAPVFELDHQAAALLYGPRPVWRSFQLGMQVGPDVRALQQNLIALGDDPTRAITVDGDYDLATLAAVERWQHRSGLPVTGEVALGEILMLPGPIIVSSVTASAGSPVSAGAPLLTATSTRQTIIAQADASDLGQINAGEPVTVTLPDGQTTVPGRIAAIGAAASSPPSATSPGASGGSSQAPTAPTVPVLVRLLSTASIGGLTQGPVEVSVTTAEARGVLTVPISALLASGSGGYVVQLVDPRSGRRRPTPVNTGLFDDTAGTVQVSGRGLRVGERVQVPSG